MNKKFTRLTAALALLVALAIPLGMWGQSTTATDVIDNAATSSNLGNTGTSTWADVFSITGSSGAVYSIRSMGTKGTNNALQWNANGYLYMTTSSEGNKLKSVTITTTTTANKNIGLYAQNTAYSAAPSGNALATIAATSSGTTYTFTSDYTYLALKGTASSTSITNITIEWVSASSGSQTESHTLTFGANPEEGGTVTVGSSTSGSITLEENATVNISATPAELGYAFNNWTVSGTGASVDNASNASTTFTMGTADATLTANFSTVTTYSITYKANGPEADDEVDTYNEGTTATVRPANTFTYAGHSFTGWNTAADGSGTDYTAGQQISNINANYVLFAQWEVSTQTTATLNIESYADAHNWSNGTRYATATVDQVTFTASDGSNTGKYYTTGKEWRYYQTESATITISVPNGYHLVSITPTYSVSNTGALFNGSTQLPSGSAVSVSGTSVTFSVGNTTSATNGQVKFTNIDVTYDSDGGSQSQSDLAITGAPVALSFDLYNASSAQTVSYTTSSTGAITISPASPTTYFSYVHDATNKTITVTPLAVTPSAQTVTISQEADDDYYAGEVSFTVSVTNSDPDVPGTVNNPYTVAEAIAAIDQLETIENAYVAGIVCQVDNYNSTYHSITYWISDDGTTTTKLQVYSGMGIGGADFSSIDDIQVNDIVTVTGKLKKYNSTYEFDYNNELVSLVRPLTTMDAIYAKAVEVGSTATEVQIDFHGWVVTGVNDNYAFVTDGTTGKGFVIQQTGHGLAAGNTLNTPSGASYVTCNLQLNGNFSALVSGVTANNLTIGTGTPTAISLPIADITGINTGALVSYTNLTCGNGNLLSDGTNSIQATKLLYSFENLTENYVYNITGVIWGYNTNKEINPRSAEDIVADNTPFINLDQYTFNYDYVAQGGYHTITYGNLDNPSFGVVYCDAQGNVLQDQTKPAMIAAAQVENNELYLTVSLNEGSASRTTYLKVCTTNTPVTYYSDLITVTQTGYAPSITVDPTEVNAPVEGATGTISAISDIIYTAPYSPEIKYYYYEGETLTETTAAYYSWLTATITNGSPLVTNGTINYTISANDGAARTAYMKVYAKDYYNTDVYSELITISQEEFVVDYATLPFSWAGGTSSELTALTGVTGNSLGDYAATNAPYRVQFDKTGDYIQVKTDSQPGIVTIGVKMIGGGYTSYITVQGSADGETFDDGEALEISGSQNDVLTLTSTRSFGENVRYVRLYFTKGSNVGVGPISITKYVAPTNHDLTVTLSENVEAIFVFNAANLDDALIEDGTAGTVQVLSGTSIVVSPVAASGYVISSLIVNNEEVISQLDESGAYTFTMPASPVTITAWAQEYVAPANYVRIFDLSQLTDGSKVVIAARYDKETTNGYYAMPAQTSGKPSGVEFTSAISSGNEILPAAIVNEEDDYYWTVNVTENGYTFTNKDNQTIGYGSSGTDFVVGGNKTEWTITRETAVETAMVGGYTGFVIKNGSTTTRAFAFSNTNVFGAYATSNMNASGYNFFLDFFVQAEVETYTLNINGYTDVQEGTNNQGYYLIASPVYVNPATVNGMTEGDFDLYYYDANEDFEWRNYEAQSFNLVPGKGYLYAKKTTTETPNYSFTLTGTPYTGSGSIGNLVEGWNLIGNPFDEAATLNVPFYKMNEDGDGLTAKIEDLSNTIATMEGVFVEATAATRTATFTVAQNNGDAVEPQAVPQVSIMVSRNRSASVVDNAIVRFDGGSMLGKFQLNANSTKLYMLQGDKEMAIVSAQAEGEMPVSFKAENNGTYTLSVNAENVEMNYLHLIDNMTGADVDLLATPSYTFEARTTDYASRFRLVFSANNVDENGASTSSATFAYFNGTNWTISNMGEATLQVVDVMGRVLSSETLSGNATVSLNQPAGVYMLRLVNGNDVKVQKVVVR